MDQPQPLPVSATFVLRDFLILMSNKKKKSRPKLKRAPREKYSEETRGADWVTIGWLLSAVTTLTAEIGGSIAFALSNESEAALLFARYMLFAAIVIGSISALLTIGVYRLRRVAPPRTVTIVVLLIVLAPIPLWAMLFGFR